MSAPNCTVELVTGSFVHLAASEDQIFSWLNGDGMFARRWVRMDSDEKIYREVTLARSAVAAVYPLKTHPTHEVTLDLRTNTVDRILHMAKRYGYGMPR